MEGNDYLCRSWFKLLIRGLVPLHNCGSRLCERAVFSLRFLLKNAVEMLKMRLSCDFLKKSCEKIWRYNKFVIILQM